MEKIRKYQGPAIGENLTDKEMANFLPIPPTGLGWLRHLVQKHGAEKVEKELRKYSQFFEYVGGSPACAGTLTYLGGAEKISEENMAKIRRRVEDRLRKTESAEDILRCAHFLGVKIDS